VIISNVPGPPFPLYYAGARMVAAYPMGPTMEGVGLNITVFSYEESVDFGFMVDRELVPDVWNMADGVRDALEELKVAAGLQPATKKPRSRSSAKAAGKSSPKGPPNGSTTTVSKPAAKTTSRTRKSPQAARKAPMRDTTA